MDNEKIISFIGKTAKFDEHGGGYIWGNDGENIQMIAEVRGWGAIQNRFSTFSEAEKFQEELGRFIAEAITEKIEKELKKSSS